MMSEGFSRERDLERTEEGKDERCSRVEIPKEEIRRLLRSQSFDVAEGS